MNFTNVSQFPLPLGGEGWLEWADFEHFLFLTEKASVEVDIILWEVRAAGTG